MEKSHRALLLLTSCLILSMEWVNCTMSGICIFADWSSFWEAVGAGFVSGLAYSFIVAYCIVIWFDRERANREIVTVRNGLKLRLDRPSPWNGISAMDCAPPGVVATTELLDKFAIDLWQARVSRELPLINALNAFAAAAAQFVTCATQVEAAIDQGIRAAIAAAGIIPNFQDVVANRALFIYYLRGRVEQQGEDLTGLPVVATSIGGQGVIFEQHVNAVPATQQAMVNLLQAAAVCRIRINTIRGLIQTSVGGN